MMPVRIRRAIAALLLVSAPFAAITPAAAKKSEEETLMQLAAECGYVISQAEGEGSQMSHGSDTWNTIVSNVSQSTGLDARPYIEMAVAKYKRMQRKMGADYTFKRLKNRAQECNAQL